MFRSPMPGTGSYVQNQALPDVTDHLLCDSVEANGFLLITFFFQLLTGGIAD